MDDPLAVGRVQRVDHFEAQRQRSGDIERLRADVLAKRHAGEQLHHEERMAQRLAHVVDGADIGMIESRRGARLALEALEGPGLAGEALGQELQGHGAAEAGVLGLVDDTHAAAAELLDDPVVGDRLADHVASAHVPTRVSVARGTPEAAHFLSDGELGGNGTPAHGQEAARPQARLGHGLVTKHGDVPCATVPPIAG